MPSFTVIIPARFASTRLPGKPLVDLAGKPMIQRVYEQVTQSDAERIVIATDHEAIFDVAKHFGAEVCMTNPAHPSGTDRLQEVASQLAFADDTIVVNVQGDEPLIPPSVINQVANLIETVDQPMATLFERIESMDHLLDPNVVKVVTSSQKQALYFSRSPMPFDRDNMAQNLQKIDVSDYKRHIGLYAYRVNLLNQFVTWPPSQLESLEKLEQLRVLEHGLGIAIDEAQAVIPPGVDNEADAERVRALLQG